MFKKLNIQRKLLVGMSVVAALSVLVIGGIGYWATVNILRASALNELNNEVNLIYGQIQGSVDTSIQNYLRSVAEKDTDIVNYYYKQYKAGILSEEDAKAEASKVLLSQTIGKSGYVYVVNSLGVLQVHPKPELVNQNISQYEFIQQQIKNKSGYIEYEWKNPGEETERPKALYMNYFAPWDWIISASSYREEFDTLVDVKDMRNNILSIKIGKTGYPYVIDTKGNLIIHPTQEGQNIYDSQDENGHYFIRELIANKNGQIIYPWKNPNDSRAREKIVIYKYLPELNYIVAAGINIDDLYSAASQYNPVIAVAVIISILLALAVSFVLARSLSKPIVTLQEVAKEIAAGDFSKQAEVISRDEIGDLARVFNKMVSTTQKNFTEISAQKEQIEAYSKELEVQKEELEHFAQHLEDMVSERTAELEATNEELIKAQSYLLKTSGDLKRLLDNTGQGFLYFDKNLLCGNEYSAECLNFFGLEDITGLNIVDLLFPNNPSENSIMTRTMSNIFTKGADMREVYLSLLPGEIIIYSRFIQLEYKVIHKGKVSDDEIDMMVILTDITEKRDLEQKMVDEKNILRMVVSVVGNFRDLDIMVNDYYEFCDSINKIDQYEVSTQQLLSQLYISVHTFKGNFSQLYMTKISEKLHELESTIAGFKQVPNLDRKQVIEFILGQELDKWVDDDLEILKRVLGESFFAKSGTVEIEIEKLREIEEHVKIVFTPDESRQLLSKLRKLRYLPFKELLHSYPGYVLNLAERLGKLINEFEIMEGEFLVNPDLYHGFVKSLIHVFRNSIDHGIELPEERLEKGKTEYGTILCSVVSDGDYIVLTISDDGQGLELEKIKARAVEAGICSSDMIDLMPSEQVCLLIFAEGLSTSNKLTDLSGRGIGLKAVANEVETLRGKIEIETELDKGTVFRFIIPNAEPS